MLTSRQWGGGAVALSHVPAVGEGGKPSPLPMMMTPAKGDAAVTERLLWGVATLSLLAMMSTVGVTRDPKGEQESVQRIDWGPSA